MSSDEDLKVKKIARMLEIGGTMLAKHCNACGAPIFRYKGEELCPVCPKSYSPSKVFQKAEGFFPNEAEKEFISPAKDIKPIKITKTELTCAEKLILEKITTILENMPQETEYARIFEQLKLIRQCLNIVKELKEIE